MAATADIAIVGMACRVPGADNPREFWRNVRGKVESIRSYSEDELRAAGVPERLLQNPNYVRAGGPLAAMEMFDAGYFGFGPRDAAILDPQHRHFLECCVEALEDAAAPPGRFPGVVGLFAGCGMGSYFAYNILTRQELLEDVGLFLLRHTGNDKDFMPTRVSYCLNLRGPSIAVQTACSTSLVAVHLACQSLLTHECDMALAGGVTIEQPHRHGYLFKTNEILSPDGHCRAFDAQSKGTVLTSGVGVVALRRLADALRDGDPIHAVIKATAINNDGNSKAGYLAPSVDGHAAVVAEALTLAGVDVDTIGLFEAHGTGTLVGDPIEVAAITQAYRQFTSRRGHVALGSVKTNIGHLDTAAGVVGLIKVVQAMRHRELPATLHYTQANPMIDFASSPFFVNTETRDWPANGAPRRGAISSLGVGGTNAHAVLEEAPDRPATAAAAPWQLLLISAKTATALDGNVARLSRHLQESPGDNLADVAYTLQAGRQAHPLRRAIAARDAAHAVEMLATSETRFLASGKAAEKPPSVVFLFPGGGAQYSNMGRDLYARFPIYARAIDECLQVLGGHLREDVRAVLFPPPGAPADPRMIEPAIGLPLLFATEYALAQLWLSWGIEPDAMTGHSLGEYTAACLAGVMSLADAMALVVLRSRLQASVPAGAILGIPLPEAEVRTLLGPELSLAAVNASELCAVSGPEHAVAALEQVLAARDVEARRVKLTLAAHSSLLDAVLDEFRAGVQRVKLSPPKRRYVSNLTGGWADAKDVTRVDYWVRHLRETVRFADGMATLLAERHCVLLEVGPGTTLSALARMQAGRTASQEVVASMRHPQENGDDVQCLLTALGRLWCAGREPDWAKVRGPESRRRLSLPTYAFDHRRYWIDAPLRGVAGMDVDSSWTRVADLGQWFYRASWRPSPLPPGVQVAHGRYVLFLDDDGPGEAVATALEAAGHEVVRVGRGPSFVCSGERRYTINPAERADYDALIEDLRTRAYAVDHFVHFWLLCKPAAGVAAGRQLENAKVLGFYALLFLGQALAQWDPETPVQVTVVTEGAQRVFDEAMPHPEYALVAGPVQVMPRELPQVRTRWVDAELPLQRWKRRFDPRGAAAKALVARLVVELTAATEDRHVALRSVGRFVSSPERVVVPPAAQPLPLQAGAAYLVTGGLGGIGLACADWLARQTRLSLVLLSRTGLPPRSEWSTYPRSAEGVGRLIGAVEQLEAHGAKVLVLRADVGNAEQVAQAVQEATGRLGPIRGVLHAAGVIDDQLLARKRVESAERVLGPKVLGALNVEAGLAGQPLDFFVLFSSTSTELGLPGQVDYVAANAFLNAFATSRAQHAGTRYLAIGWGVWADVGMAARAVQVTPASARPSGHPWLGDVVSRTPGSTQFEARYSTGSMWLLDEHRIKGGRALVPGSGFLEIARAALHMGGTSPSMDVSELSFLAPLEVEDEPADVRITLSPDGGRFDFRVSSRIAATAEWQDCVRGSLAFGAGGVPRADVTAIRASCNRSHVEFAAYGQETKQERHLDFGPRWKVLRRVDYGSTEALARLELGREHAGDVDTIVLHPALLDLGCHVGLPLVPGYDTCADLFVPLSFGHVRTFERLPARVLSWVRLVSGRAGDDIVTFDVTFLGEDGTVLVEIERFIVRRLREGVMASRRVARLAESPDATVARAGGDEMLRENVALGIHAAEGTEALARLLGHGMARSVWVTPVRLEALVQRVDRMAAPKADSDVQFVRPEMDKAYQAPSTPVEKRIAEMWQQLLGVDRVGVDDDFFELGGQSLVAVRLFARIRKAWGVDLGLATLFEAPTVAKLAALVQPAAGAGAEQQSEPGTPVRPAVARGWTTLVPIQPKGQRPPFYCAAGQGGNAMNLRHLAIHLGEDQPFYGLQARGVDGRQRPHESVQAMAAEYIADIRRFQPHGPYMIGGYSGGGTAAFEMAQQLTAQGERVGALVFLDSHSPWMPRRTRAERARLHLRRLVEQGPSYVFDKLKERLVGNEISRLKRWFVRPLARLFPYHFRGEAMVYSWVDAFARYEAKPWPGCAHLFRVAIDDAIWWSGVKMEDDLGWRPLLSDLKVVVTPGDHTSMCEEPHVRVLADHLRACLDRAIAAETTPATPHGNGTAGSAAAPPAGRATTLAGGAPPRQSGSL